VSKFTREDFIGAFLLPLCILYTLLSILSNQPVLRRCQGREEMVLKVSSACSCSDCTETLSNTLASSYLDG
jgi:hypothetical protein